MCSLPVPPIPRVVWRAPAPLYVAVSALGVPPGGRGWPCSIPAGAQALRALPHVRNGLFDVLFLPARPPLVKVAQIFTSATTERLHNLPEIGC